MEMRQKAMGVAAALLAGRMYTCREIYDRLVRRGYDKELAEQVVEEFVRAGFLNDARYAQCYIADAAALGAKGKTRIRQELRQKGVAAKVIDDAMEEAEADFAGALADYVRQRDLCAAVHSRKDFEKLKARLLRRGYSMKEINRCLEEYSFNFDE